MEHYKTLVFNETKNDPDEPYRYAHPQIIYSDDEPPLTKQEFTPCSWPIIMGPTFEKVFESYKAEWSELDFDEVELIDLKLENSIDKARRLYCKSNRHTR